MGLYLRVAGYLIRQFDSDHPPLHVHIYRDRRLVAKFDLEGQRFMQVDARHRGRLLKALGKAGLLAPDGGSDGNE